MNRFLSAMLGLALTVSGGLAVADEAPGPTGSIGVGTFKFDEDGILDNDSLGSIIGGYRFDNPWAIELGYLRANPETVTGLDTDVSSWRLDGLYNFDAGPAFTPFVSFGAGRATIDVAGTDASETQFNLGVGGKLFFHDSTAFRADLKFFRSSDANDIALIVGLHHSFGARAAGYTPPPVVDSDRDGVPDDDDRCPGTPSGVVVDSRGCPVDSDRDGVADYLDKCPDTTNRRARIDADGCYVVLAEKVSVELNVEFDNNSAETRPEHKSEVRKVVKFMEEYPQTRVTIEGHTDSRGSADYNRDLSQRRANAIAEMLVTEFNIPRSRVSAVGYGEDRPIATNDTEEGRQRNRRVVGVVEATVEKIESR